MFRSCCFGEQGYPPGTGGVSATERSGRGGRSHTFVRNAFRLILCERPPRRSRSRLPLLYQEGSFARRDTFPLITQTGSLAGEDLNESIGGRGHIFSLTS